MNQSWTTTKSCLRVHYSSLMIQQMFIMIIHATRHKDISPYELLFKYIKYMLSLVGYTKWTNLKTTNTNFDFDTSKCPEKLSTK